jgi:hypothetical protein
MVVCAMLLAGIVAVQVAALRQNIARGELEQTRQRLVAQNMTLQARLDEARSRVKVEERARQLGMYQPPSDSVEYLTGGGG